MGWEAEVYNLVEVDEVVWPGLVEVKGLLDGPLAEGDVKEVQEKPVLAEE